MNVVDTSGWLEYIGETSNADNYEKAISDVEKLIVPSIVIYEVFKKIMTDFDEDKALTVIAYMKLGKVVDIDESIAIYAAKISKENKLPMADSLIYAVTSRCNATLYTQDDHFKGMKNVKYFEKKKGA
jgi:toxin FitB